MLRRHVICIYVCVLAAWMQFLAPVAAMTKASPADPFGVICAKVAADPGRDAPPVHHHTGDCCLLCHAYLGAAPLGERPVFTVFDYPVASPLRWRALQFIPTLAFTRGDSLPRGPPSLV